MKRILKSYTFIVTILSLFISAIGLSIYFYKSTSRSLTPFNVLTHQQESTLAIIKPKAVEDHHTGDIIKLIELNKFTINRMDKRQLARVEAEQFYAMHKEKPFFNDLVASMSKGPVVILVLEKSNAVQAWRELMGATNPAKAAPGTLRYMFGTDVTNNAVHGSDAAETAQKEINFFFANSDFVQDIH